jgi:hypothetical protein
MIGPTVTTETNKKGEDRQQRERGRFIYAYMQTKMTAHMHEGHS